MNRVLVPLFTLSVLIFWLSSCAQPVPVAFMESDFIRSQSQGSGSISGNAFTEFTNGDRKILANGVVELVPVNAYTTEVFDMKYETGSRVATDPRYERYVRTARTDARGYFQFHNLPPGDYYVGGKVRYSIVKQGNFTFGTDPYDPYYNQTMNYWQARSQMIYVKIQVQNGKTTNVQSWNQLALQDE